MTLQGERMSGKGSALFGLSREKQRKHLGVTMMAAVRTIPRLAGILAALLFFLSPASSAEDLGPAIGTTAPDIGIRLDQLGKPRQLPDLMGRNGLVLFFFRSADWCPFCQAQLLDINTGVAEIEKRGYRVAGLSYDSPRSWRRSLSNVI
jgi:hypothetical protein